MIKQFAIQTAKVKYLILAMISCEHASSPYQSRVRIESEEPVVIIEKGINDKFNMSFAYKFKNSFMDSNFLVLKQALDSESETLVRLHGT